MHQRDTWASQEGASMLAYSACLTNQQRETRLRQIHLRPIQANLGKISIPHFKTHALKPKVPMA